MEFGCTRILQRYSKVILEAGNSLHYTLFRCIGLRKFLEQFKQTLNKVKKCTNSTTLKGDNRECMKFLFPDKIHWSNLLTSVYLAFMFQLDMPSEVRGNRTFGSPVRQVMFPSFTAMLAGEDHIISRFVHDLVDMIPDFTGRLNDTAFVASQDDQRICGFCACFRIDNGRNRDHGRRNLMVSQIRGLGVRIVADLSCLD